jgi:hypothetical protein
MAMNTATKGPATLSRCKRILLGNAIREAGANPRGPIWRGVESAPWPAALRELVVDGMLVEHVAPYSASGRGGDRPPWYEATASGKAAYAEASTDVRSYRVLVEVFVDALTKEEAEAAAKADLRRPAHEPMTGLARTVAVEAVERKAGAA